MENEILTTRDFEDFILNEVTVYSGSDKKGKIKLALAVDPSPNRNYGDDAYFKVYHGKSFNGSDCIARITFKSPARYIIHRGPKRHKDLDKDQIEILTKLVRDPSPTIPGYTVWEELLYKFNKEVQPKDRVDINCPIPNFYELLKR